VFGHTHPVMPAKAGIHDLLCPDKENLCRHDGQTGGRHHVIRLFHGVAQGGRSMPSDRIADAFSKDATK
jgi:hypothetical protein